MGEDLGLVTVPHIGRQDGHDLIALPVIYHGQQTSRVLNKKVRQAITLFAYEPCPGLVLDGLYDVGQVGVPKGDVVSLQGPLYGVRALGPALSSVGSFWSSFWHELLPMLPWGENRALYGLLAASIVN